MWGKNCGGPGRFLRSNSRSKKLIPSNQFTAKATWASLSQRTRRDLPGAAAEAAIARKRRVHVHPWRSVAACYPARLVRVPPARAQASAGQRSVAPSRVTVCGGLQAVRCPAGCGRVTAPHRGRWRVATRLAIARCALAPRPLTTGPAWRRPHRSAAAAPPRRAWRRRWRVAQSARTRGHSAAYQRPRRCAPRGGRPAAAVAAATQHAALCRAPLSRLSRQRRPPQARSRGAIAALRSQKAATTRGGWLTPAARGE